MHRYIYYTTRRASCQTMEKNVTIGECGAFQKEKLKKNCPGSGQFGISDKKELSGFA